MRASGGIISAIILGAITILPFCVFGAGLREVTPSEFLRTGAGVLVGEIVEVAVEQRDERVETGTAVVKVVEVLTGEVEGTQIDFPYHRRIEPAYINPQPWEMVTPAVGQKLIIFFYEEDGMYYPSKVGRNSIIGISDYADSQITALRELIHSHGRPR